MMASGLQVMHGHEFKPMVTLDAPTSRHLSALAALFAAAVCFVLPSGPFRPPGLGDFNPSLLSVFGIDDRTEFVATERPWTAIGRIELRERDPASRSSTGKVPICTGVLVWRDLVLTNAHCIMDRETQQISSKKVWFRPAYHHRKGALGDSHAVRAWLGTKTPSQERSRDWAILKIDRPLGDQVGWIDVVAVDSEAELPFGAGLFFIAYGSDFERGGVASWQEGCKLTAFDRGPGYLRHDCDMNSGASGAPLLIKRQEEGQVRIVGLNAAHTSRTYNSYYDVFSPRRANIAVSTNEFYGVLKQLIGEDGPALVDKTRVKSDISVTTATSSTTDMKDVSEMEL